MEKMETESWLKDCLICNTGLCKTVDELKVKGLTENKSCHEMAKKSNGLFSGKQILDRYRYHTGKDKSVAESVVYFIQSGEEGLIKIGSSTDLINRIITLQIGNPCELKLRESIKGNWEKEKEIQNKFQHIKYRGEWFFPTVELTNYIKEIKGE